MDVQAVSAGGIIILALLLAISIISRWYQSEKQVKILSDQFKIQRSQVVPYITVGGFKVEGDDIIVDLSNQSDVDAYWLGVKTQFFQVRPSYYSNKEDRQALNVDQVRQYEKEGKTVYVRYSAIPWKELVYKDDAVVPKGVINFSPDMPTPVFARKEHKHARFQPLFGVSAFNGGWSQTFDTIRLREFLSQNQVSYTAFSFTIVYKDITETPIGAESVDTFVFVLEEHKTLQQAWKKHYPIDYVPLSAGDILTRLKYIGEDQYNNVWSTWNSSGPLNKS